jgi:G6PDH family F420-dependent oxidoreductase
VKIGYTLSSEDHSPRQLVEQAKRAQAAGFHGLWISDHYHPWIDEQGHSPFVWSVIGAVSEATGLPLTTGVTCPSLRIHPAIIAQAAATSALLLDGRFSLASARARRSTSTSWARAGRRPTSASRCSRKRSR